MASNKTLKQILTALYDTLTASPSLVPDTVKQIVRGVNADTSDGFPFVRIYLLLPSSPVADTITYERKHTFAVEILQEATNKSKQNAEEDLCTAIEGVLNRLNGTFQLGVGVENTEIQISPVTNQEINGAWFRVAKITVEVTTLVENPT